MVRLSHSVAMLRVLAGVILLGVASSATAAEPGSGQTVAGLQASLRVDRSRALIGGEGPNLTFFLANVSGRPIKIFDRLAFKWPGTNSLATVGVAIDRLDGAAYEPSERIADLTKAPRAEEFTWLGPGDTVSAGPISVQGARGIRQAGRFRIIASYSNHFVDWVSQDGTVHEEPDVWTGTVVSNAVTIDIEE